jgi:hypothetical protein
VEYTHLAFPLPTNHDPARLLTLPRQDRNVILALAYEYRAPPAAAVRQAVEDAGEATAVPWDSRYVGLVVVPGQHVRKIELEESLHPGMKSGVLL